jgi:hypothetical protein
MKIRPVETGVAGVSAAHVTLTRMSTSTPIMATVLWSTVPVIVDTSDPQAVPVAHENIVTVWDSTGFGDLDYLAWVRDPRTGAVRSVPAALVDTGHLEGDALQALAADVATQAEADRAEQRAAIEARLRTVLAEALHEVAAGKDVYRVAAAHVSLDVDDETGGLFAWGWTPDGVLYVTPGDLDVSATAGAGI